MYHYPKRPRTPSSAVACETCSGIDDCSDRNVYKGKVQEVDAAATAEVGFQK
jgi:hypothetical protein